MGDVLNIRITHNTRELIRGEIIEIIKPGEKRIEAPCPHFAVCGGCSLQQMEIGYYQEFKRKIVSNALRQTGFMDATANTIFLPPASRRRAEFKLLKEEGKWHFAYLGRSSHTKTAITSCLILEPQLQNILPLLQDNIGSLPFVQDIESVSITKADSGLEVILQLNSVAKSLKTGNFVSELKHIAEAAYLTRIAIVNNAYEPLEAIENGALTMRLGNIDITLPHDAFLQATSEGQKLLTGFALSGTNGAKRIADLFCGIGTYSVAMAENARVHAIDDHALMIANLKQVASSHKLNLTAETRNLFTKPLSASDLKSFDVVVINPPRLGAKSQCEQIALSNIRNVVMVSCNPATFARDARILKNAGFTLKDALAIDQFVWSPHLEIAASFVR